MIMLAFPHRLSTSMYIRVPNPASHYLTGFLEAHIEIVLGYRKMSLCPSPSKVSVPPPSKVSVPRPSKVSVPHPSKVSVPQLSLSVPRPSKVSVPPPSEVGVPLLVKLVSPS